MTKLKKYALTTFFLGVLTTASFTALLDPRMETAIAQEVTTHEGAVGIDAGKEVVRLQEPEATTKVKVNNETEQKRDEKGREETLLAYTPTIIFPSFDLSLAGQEYVCKPKAK